MIDVQRAFLNGSLCKQFVQEYVSFVSVEAPVSRILVTEKEKVLSFYGVLGTLGGTFGLFTGMSLLSFAEIVIFLVIFVHAVGLETLDTLLGKVSDGKSYCNRLLETETSVNVRNCLFLFHGQF